MNLQKRIFIFFGIPVLILVSIIGILVARTISQKQVIPVSTDDDLPPIINIEDLNGDAGERTDLEKVPVPQTAEEQQELYLKQLSRLFTERLFSYSNQAGNSNIDDVSVFATTKMKKYLQTLKVEQSAEYEGVTTKLFQSEVTSMTEDEATVQISVIQEITTRESTEKSQKSGKMLFIKDSNGNWLVDGLFWD